MGISIADCMLCEHRQRPCSGYCACKINGKQIAENVEAGCPIGKIGRPVDAKLPKPLQPIPRQDWPAHILVIAANASDQDEGVGDTLKRNIHRFPEWLVDFGTSIKATWNALVKGKKSCGCDSDRRRLNALYPYNRETVDRVE